MTDPAKDGRCPPACRLELKHITEGLEALNKMETTQWEEIAKRPKLGPLLWITGLAVGVLCALLGLIYDATRSVSEDVVDLKVQQTRIETQIDTHMENSRNNAHYNRRSHPDGG